MDERAYFKINADHSVVIVSGKIYILNQKILALFTNKNRKSRSQEEFKQNKKKIRA